LRKQQMLTDDDVRGTDRLVLILKLMPSWVTAEWMAQQWRDGRRVKVKIGSCPTLTLLQTRKIFACDSFWCHLAAGAVSRQQAIPVPASLIWSGRQILQQIKGRWVEPLQIVEEECKRVARAARMR